MQRYLIMWRSYDYIEAWDEIDYGEISISEMKRTGQFIKEYKFWFLALPKAKNDFTTEQFILREKDNKLSDLKYKELYELIEWFSKSDYTCRRNSISMQSAPLFVHYHIAKFKNMDKEISESLIKTHT